MITRAQQFVEQVYWPDVLAIAGFYKDWAVDRWRGEELPRGRRISRGRRATTPRRLYLKRGIVLDRDLTRVWPYDQNQIKEYITSSWYEYSKGDDAGLHPYEGETNAEVHRSADAVEVPPGLAEVHLDEGAALRRQADGGRAAGPRCWWASPPVTRRSVPWSRKCSTGCRSAPRPSSPPWDESAARGMETVLLARRMNVLVRQVGRANQERGHRDLRGRANGSRRSWPAKAQGYGYLDAPRGALGHWVQIENGKISRYQCVVPSTWNCSPRDAQGQMGPYEAALVDNHPSA